MVILVISAHPDDETIGAGGTILKHVDQGDSVYWCVVTQGYSPPWTEETLKKAKEQIKKVQKAYGIKEVFRCGFPTVKLNTVPYIELSSSLQKVVDQVKPEIVYVTPRSDINLDHRIVYECVLVACRPLPGSSVRRILSYEICATTSFGLPAGINGFNPTVFIDISKYLNEKLEIMKLYETELCPYPHPRSLEGIKLFAEERGLSVGLKAAERFELIRELI